MKYIHYCTIADLSAGYVKKLFSLDDVNRYHHRVFRDSKHYSVAL